MVAGCCRRGEVGRGEANVSPAKSRKFERQGRSHLALDPENAAGSGDVESREDAI